MNNIQPKWVNDSGLVTPNLGFVDGGKEANSTEFDTSAEDKVALLIPGSGEQSTETPHEANAISQKEHDDPMSLEHVAVLGYN